MNKADILLVIPPAVDPSTYLIGPAYIVSYLKANDFKAKIVDLNCKMITVNSNDEPYWSDRNNVEEYYKENKNRFKESVRELLDYSPKIIGFALWEVTKWSSLILARLIKDSDSEILIVFGGYECSLSAGELIRYPQVDIVIRHEAEEAMGEIAREYLKHKRVDFCAGTVIKNDMGIKDCSIRAAFPELDDLPFPDYSDYPGEKRSLPIGFNRGCMLKCSYCNMKGHVRKFRTRSAESIFSEMRCQKERFPDLELFTEGDTGALQDMRVLENVCDLIIENDFEIAISTWSFLSPRLNKNILKKMKRAGFCSISYGLESGSDRVLKKMGKIVTAYQAGQIIRETSSAGIDVILSFIVGFPGETEEDFSKTLRFIRVHKDYIRKIAGLNELHLLKGSELSSKHDKYGIEVDMCGVKWKSKRGKNTHKIRKERVRRAYETIRDCGIEISESAIKGLL